jgi:hypothetical protein
LPFGVVVLAAVLSGLTAASIDGELYFKSTTTLIGPHLPSKDLHIIMRAVLMAVYNIYQNNPDIYLGELVFWLAIHHDIAISR